MRCFSEGINGGHFILSFQRWSAIHRIKRQTFNTGIIRRDSSRVNVACDCDKPSVEAESSLKSVSQTTFTNSNILNLGSLAFSTCKLSHYLVCMCLVVNGGDQV